MRRGSSGRRLYQARLERHHVPMRPFRTDGETEEGKVVEIHVHHRLCHVDRSLFPVPALPGGFLPRLPSNLARAALTVCQIAPPRPAPPLPALAGSAFIDAL